MKAYKFVFTGRLRWRYRWPNIRMALKLLQSMIRGLEAEVVEYELEGQALLDAVKTAMGGRIVV